MAQPLQSPATMRTVVFVALMATTGGCILVDSVLTVDCVEHVQQSVPFTTPNDDTALQFKIDRCQLDSDACNELCTLALERSGVGNPVTACHVEFSSTGVVVNVTFDRQTMAPGCPVQFGGADDTAMPTPGGTTGSGK